MIWPHYACNDCFSLESRVNRYIDLEDTLVVTGEHGDQLFGSILMNGAFSEDQTPNWLFPTGTPADLDLAWQQTVTNYLN
eukprot:SAG31_NODE_885_length_11254_cov_14.613088_10_plen_79_part_01